MGLYFFQFMQEVLFFLRAFNTRLRGGGRLHSVRFRTISS